jgi:DNA polymerase III subunit delta'
VSATATASGRTVWAEVVGQERVVAELAAAAAAAAAVLAGRPGTGMVHAWLITGPPGSGRSTAARAFAAALQCPDQGCGDCPTCHTVLAGTHADVDLVRPSLLSLGVDEAREMVRRAALLPAGGRWQVMIVEDADRLTERAADALLKAIEEPPARTVWLLCVPSPDDLVPTVRSRCRLVSLRTPAPAAVAELLHGRDAVDPAMAAFAARAAQGHIGRARRLATDEGARLRRQEVLRIPAGVADVDSALQAAANLVDAAAEEAAEVSAELDRDETAQLRRALGEGTVGRAMPRHATAALRDLTERQKTRAKRLQRDALDRALVDLASFYRDVLAVQFAARVEPVNDTQHVTVVQIARTTTPEVTLRRLEAVLAARVAVDANVAPLLALEAMTLTLLAGEHG